MKHTRKLLALFAFIALLAGAVGCEKKGPMEKAGEAVDKAAEDVKDAFKKDGPMEKAGEALDDAAKDVKKAVKDAADDVKDKLDDK